MARVRKKSFRNRKHISTAALAGRFLKALERIRERLELAELNALVKQLQELATAIEKERRAEEKAKQRKSS